MVKTIGTYHFGRHRGSWGIWQVSSITNGVTMSDHIKDVIDYQTAVKEVYRLNGWGEPKAIIQKY